MDLLWRIECYLKTSETSPTRFGRAAAHDPRLVFDLRNGRTLRSSTETRIAAWLDARMAEEAR